MKKIISICSLIVIAALVVTVFTACGGDDNATTSTTSPATTTNEVVIGTLTLTVNETNAVVYNDGVLFQTLTFPQGKGTPFVFEYAKEHFDFIDMNFDGNLDVYIAVADDEGTIHYYCWLYNATTKVFDYSISLSGLTNISVNAAEQLIFAIGYDTDGNKVISKYTFENGSLKFLESYNEADEIPEDIDQNVNNNSIGDKPTTGGSATGGTTAPSGTNGTTKPLLTTQPQSGGIVLVDPTEEVWY